MSTASTWLTPIFQAAPQPMIDLGSPTAFFTFGPDGMLYVPMLLEGKVVRLERQR